MSIDYQKKYEELRAKNLDLAAENRQLQALIDGDYPAAYYRMQGKIQRQGAALDVLNRKVLSQRFRLRTVAALGRDLTKEEYETEKEKLENPQVQGRILDYEVVG